MIFRTKSISLKNITYEKEMYMYCIMYERETPGQMPHHQKLKKETEQLTLGLF